MALEDRYIFTAIFAKYSDQPIEFVMEQYEKAKLLNMAIEKRLWDQSRVVACPASESPAQKEEKKPEKPQDRVPESVFGNFSFYSYKKACGQKKTVRGSKNSRRLSNGTPAI